MPAPPALKEGAPESAARASALKDGPPELRSRAGAFAPEEGAVALPAQQFSNDAVSFRFLGAETSPRRPPLTREEQSREAQRFAAVAATAGLDALVEPRTGRTLSALTRELAESLSPAELKQKLVELDVGAAATPPRGDEQRGARPSERDPVAALVPERTVDLDRGARQDAARVQPWTTEAGKVLIQPVERGLASAPETARAVGRTTSKMLGRKMLWNVLHRFRGAEQEESALSRDEWDRVAVAALLLLLGVGDHHRRAREPLT